MKDLCGNGILKTTNKHAVSLEWRITFVIKYLLK